MLLPLKVAIAKRLKKCFLDPVQILHNTIQNIPKGLLVLLWARHLKRLLETSLVKFIFTRKVRLLLPYLKGAPPQKLSLELAGKKTSGQPETNCFLLINQL